MYLLLLFKMTTKKIKITYVVHICDLCYNSVGQAILEFTVHDTLMFHSRKFPTLYPFIPILSQAKAILTALFINPGEWWSF